MSLTLQEARQLYSPSELSDKQLMELIEEVDSFQCQILDSLFSAGSVVDKTKGYIGASHE